MGLGFRNHCHFFFFFSCSGNLEHYQWTLLIPVISKLKQAFFKHGGQRSFPMGDLRAPIPSGKLSPQSHKNVQCVWGASGNGHRIPQTRCGDRKLPTRRTRLRASDPSVPTDIQNRLGNKQPSPAGPPGGCWPGGPGYLTTAKTVAKVGEGQRGQAVTAG